MDITKIDRNYYGEIKQSTLESIERYVNHRIQAGGFLTAVLSNDLKGAVDFGDDENRKALAKIVIFIYNNAPISCWGSREKVNAWLSNSPVE